jgi:DNA-binding CsgD family transcriptional regulator
MNGGNPDQFSLPPLTEREQDVLTLIGDGLTNREIAGRLTVAISTVKWYVRQIYNKLGADNREETVALSLARLATADLLMPTIAEAAGYQFQEEALHQAQLAPLSSLQSPAACVEQL